jgi:hypothetical protein
MVTTLSSFVTLYIITGLDFYLRVNHKFDGTSHEDEVSHTLNPRQQTLNPKLSTPNAQAQSPNCQP